jgi:hypothetical protein
MFYDIAVESIRKTIDLNIVAYRIDLKTDSKRTHNLYVVRFLLLQSWVSRKNRLSEYQTDEIISSTDMTLKYGNVEIIDLLSQLTTNLQEYFYHETLTNQNPNFPLN